MLTCRSINALSPRNGGGGLLTNPGRNGLSPRTERGDELAPAIVRHYIPVSYSDSKQRRDAVGRGQTTCRIVRSANIWIMPFEPEEGRLFCTNITRP